MEPDTPPSAALVDATAAARRRTRPRWQRWALRSTLGLVAVLALALLALIAAWQTLRTDRGTAWLLSQVSGLTVRDARGSMQGGPFSASHVEFALKGSPVSVQIDGLAWRNLQWRWRPYSGIWAGWVIEGLHAERVEIHTAPSDKKAAPPTSLRMPFELVLPDAQVQTLQIDALAPIRELHAALHFGADRGEQHRVDALSLRWDRLHLQAHGQIATDKGFPVVLDASLRSQPVAPDGGVLALPWAAELTARGPLAQLAIESHLHSTQPAANAASMDVRSTLTPFDAWPLASLDATLHQVDVGALVSAAPRTRLEGHAVLTTRGLDQPARVDLQLRNDAAGRWDEQRLPLRALTLDLRGQPNRLSALQLQAFAVDFGNEQQAAGRWTGEGRWAAGRLELHTTIHALQPSGLDRRMLPATLSGPVDLTIQDVHAPNGTTGAGWKAQLDGQLEGRSAPDAPLVQARVQADAATSAQGLALTLRQLQATSGSARLTAEGHAERHDARWQVDAHGELHRFDPAQWWPGPEGSAWRQGPHQLNGQWAISAAFAAPVSLAALQGQAQLTLDDSVLAGVPLKGRLRARAQQQSPWTTELALESGGNHLNASGQFAPSQPSVDRWTLDAQLPQLAALSPLLRVMPTLAPWAPTAGSVNAHAQLQGRWPRIVTQGELQIDALRAGNAGLAKAHAQWTLGDGADAPLRLSLVADDGSIGVQHVDHLQADIAGSARNHHIAVQAATTARPPAWAESLTTRTASRGTSLQWTADGSWLTTRDGTRWQLRTQRLWAGATPATTAPATVASTAPTPLLLAENLSADIALDEQLQPRQAAMLPGALRVLGGSLQWSAMRWQAATRTSSAQLDVQAELQPLAIAPMLARLQPDFGWGGDLVVAGHARLHTGASFQADVVVERQAGDLSVTDEGGTQTLGLTDLRLGLVANQGLWYFTQALAGRTVGVLAGAQSLRVPATAIWPSPQAPLNGVLELRVDNLGVWGPWTPPGWRLAGTLHTTASLGGRFGAPEYTGRLEGHDVGARNLLQGINLTDGEIVVALKGPTADVQTFTVKAGDGSARLTGGATFGEAPHADLRLAAEHFQLLGRVDRRIVTSGQAQLSLRKDVIKLDGRFHIDDGLFDFNRSNAPTLDEDVNVVRKRKPGDSEDAPAAAKPRQLDLQLAIDLGDHLRVRGKGLDALLRGDLHMTTPGSRLAVNGTVRAEEGTYAAYGQKLDIERGLLHFIGPLDDPRLDILAVRPNLDVRVGVAIDGTALKPHVRLFSEPEMSDHDKLSWLVLGRAPEGLGRSDTALLQHAAMALLSGEGGSTTDKVMQTLGLDDFSLRQEGEGDVKTTIVSLGKQISRRWYVGYERGLESTTGTWQLIYRIAQRFTVRAQSGEDNAIDVIWTWRWN